MSCLLDYLDIFLVRQTTFLSFHIQLTVYIMGNGANLFFFFNYQCLLFSQMSLCETIHFSWFLKDRVEWKRERRKTSTKKEKKNANKRKNTGRQGEGPCFRIIMATNIEVVYVQNGARLFSARYRTPV